MANRRFAKKIDTVHWTGFAQASLALAAAGTVGATLNAAQHLPETLMRIRGEWGAVFDGPQAAGNFGRAHAGIILVPEGTGATVLWSPATDADAPWIWWDVFHFLYEEMVTDAIAAWPSGGNARVMDSKAMRKNRNQELQIVFENIPIVGSGAMNFSVSGRVLSGS